MSTPTPPSLRTASSVVVVAPTDSAQDPLGEYRLLMVKRSSNSSFMKNLSVFPGGVYEDSDASADWLDLYPTIDQITPEHAWRITGARELFEETGVLALKALDGGSTEAGSRLSAEERSLWRKKVHNNAVHFIDLCRSLAAAPDIAIPKFAHWITPIVEKKRFDTHFYIVELTEQVSAVQDGVETTNAVWHTPAEFLSLRTKGEIAFAPPQLYMLNEMVTFYPSIKALRSSSQNVVTHFPTILASDEKDATVCVHLAGDDKCLSNPGGPGARNRVEINTADRSYTIVSDRLPASSRM